MNNIKDLYSEKFDKLNNALGKMSYHNAAEGSKWSEETKQRLSNKREVEDLTTDLVSLGVTLEEFRANTNGGLFRLKDIFTAKAWGKLNE
jgi:hypothetical protein